MRRATRLQRGDGRPASIAGKGIAHHLRNTAAGLRSACDPNSL
jgi:uncharacterized cupin superfamily protein